MSSILEWHNHSQEFYAHVGICILKYQGIEDFQRFIFASALRCELDQSSALFEPAGKDLNRKFQFIEVALASRQDLPEFERWTEIRTKVQQAAEKRHTIAHSQPVIYGGGVSVDLEAEPPTARRLGPQEWQARKKQKNGERVWRLEDLKVFVGELDLLEQILRDFNNTLKLANRSSEMQK